MFYDVGLKSKHLVGCFLKRYGDRESMALRSKLKHRKIRLQLKMSQRLNGSTLLNTTLKLTASLSIFNVVCRVSLKTCECIHGEKPKEKKLATANI